MPALSPEHLAQFSWSGPESASVVKRSAGHSAVAAAAYRAGEKLADERADKVHDYSRRRGVDAAEILAPPGAPAWALNRETLWNRVEAAEQRADSQVAREIRVAIPIELSRDAGRELIRDYVKKEFVDRGMVADVAWHDEGGRNPHAHILLTMRQIDRDDFGPKVRQWNDKKNLAGWREAWADAANHALEAHGSPERIDHRTLEAQRIDAEARGDREAALRLDRPPTVHRGKVLTHNPGAAPDHHLRFADAEAERRVAIALAEETIQLEARIAAGAAEQKRLFRELGEAANDIIDAIPEAIRAEGLAHAAQPPRALPTPPTIEGQVLAAELNRRVLDTIPEAMRAEGLAHAAEPPRALLTPPTIEGQVIVAEGTDRVEKRAAAAEAAERNRRLLDAIPEATRAEGLAHAAQPPRALLTPPTIEGQVLAAERTDRVEKRAAAEAAEAADREAAHAARAASSAFELAAMNARHYETRDVAADLVASQPARVPWDPVEAELDRRHATDDHRYNERMDIGHGVKLDLGGPRMDLESQIIEHAKSGRSRVPPARQATLGATITAVVESIQKGADQLVNSILDKVLGRVRDPAPTAATLTAAAPTAAPADEQPAPPAPHPDPSLVIRDEPARQPIQPEVYGPELNPDRGAGEGAGGTSPARNGRTGGGGIGGRSEKERGYGPMTTRGIGFPTTARAGSVIPSSSRTAVGRTPEVRRPTRRNCTNMAFFE